MGQYGHRSSQGGKAGATTLGTAIDAMAGVMTQTLRLRRECEDLMARHGAGLADDADRHRYRMARLRLLLLEATHGGVRPPHRAAEVLAERSELDFRALVGASDPSPEPQPS